MFAVLQKVECINLFVMKQKNWIGSSESCGTSISLIKNFGQFEVLH